MCLTFEKERRVLNLKESAEFTFDTARLLIVVKTKVFIYVDSISGT